MKIFVCRHCGSKNVAHDARATWDESAQEWRLATLYDSADCDDCEDETLIIEMETEQWESL